MYSTPLSLSVKMGQYYIPMILGSLENVKITKKEFIRLWLSSFSYDNGQKLMEHSYLNNAFVSALEYQISPDGPHHMSRVVWAGDYADKEYDSDLNLHEMVDDAKLQVPNRHDTSFYRYILNHTKKQYVDKDKCKSDIHPLPLLTAEGNGRGGGDYYGRHEELCGTWARDLISVDRELPDDYTEIHCDFE